jgi:hypothetical protein
MGAQSSPCAGPWGLVGAGMVGLTSFDPWLGQECARRFREARWVFVSRHGAWPLWRQAYEDPHPVCVPGAYRETP